VERSFHADFCAAFVSCEKRKKSKKSKKRREKTNREKRGATIRCGALSGDDQIGQNVMRSDLDWEKKGTSLFCVRSCSIC